MNLKLAALLKSKIFISCASALATVATAATIIVTVNQPDAYRIIKVFELDGSATIERSSIGELDAYEEMNLENGDLIDVHEDSTMRLILDSDKYIQLDSLTRLELLATGNETDSLTTINLLSGTILNEITAPLSEGSSYNVNTPKSTMAVRGTSFIVSVEQNDDGSYITNLYAFHGVVEVQLIDEEGNPKGSPVNVLENQAVAIMTTQNDETANDANIDGYSFFVVEDAENGDYRPVAEDENPVTGFDYHDIPASMLEQALNTNNNNEITLDDAVLQEILAVLNGEPSTVSDNNAVSENKIEETLNNSVSINNTGNTDTTVSDNSVSENTISENNTPVARPEISQNEVPVTPSENSISENTVSKNTISRNTVSQNIVTTTTEEDTSDDSSDNSSDTSNDSVSDNTVSENDVTYTVTFVGRNGESLSTQTVFEGESASAPAVADEVYDSNGVLYIFTGWSADFSNVTSNMTITAQYAIKTHIVTYSARNTTSGAYETHSTEEVNHNTVVTPPGISTDPFTVNGTIYQFSSWSYAGSGITSDTTIQAEYTETAATHTVTFSYRDANGNATTTTQTVTHGNTVTNAPSPATYTLEDDGTTTQYQCSGWDKDINQTITEDITFTAQYTETPLTHTVTFSYRDANGNATTTTQTVTHGNTVTNAPSPTTYTIEKNNSTYNYIFTAWSNIPATITDSIEITAQYSENPISHWVFFSCCNGGTEFYQLAYQASHGEQLTLNAADSSSYTGYGIQPQYSAIDCYYVMGNFGYYPSQITESVTIVIQYTKMSNP